MSHGPRTARTCQLAVSVSFPTKPLLKSTHHASVGSLAKLVEVQTGAGSVQLHAVTEHPGAHASSFLLAALEDRGAAAAPQVPETGLRCILGARRDEPAACLHALPSFGRGARDAGEHHHEHEAHE